MTSIAAMLLHELPIHINSVGLKRNPDRMTYLPKEFVVWDSGDISRSARN
jgi:hypothetical protein